MKPYISIIVPTMRIGGLDVLFSGLEQQTFKDFELVLIDDLYEQRKQLVSDRLSQYSFAVKHVPSLDSNFTATKYCKAMNTGLVNASGSIVLYIPDYTWAHLDCLETHAAFHKTKTNLNSGFICSYNFCKLPPLHSDFSTPYASNYVYSHETNNIFIEKESEAFIKYINDLNSGKLQPLMWSIFDKEFDRSSDPRSFEITSTKDAFPEGEVPTSCCYLRNESYTMANMLDMNGFNEELDGSHGWQDWEFASRITGTLGVKLYHKHAKTATVIDPRTVLYGRLRVRNVFSNEGIWKHGIATNFQQKVNAWSIREERNKKLGINE